MTAYLTCKLLITLMAFLFCALPSPSATWIISCLFMSGLFVLRIPPSQRKIIAILFPLIVAIAAMQFISALVSGTNYLPRAITGFKILCTGSIVISARFFIGREALKLFAHSLPKTAALFLLVFARTIYSLSRLNRMIVFQLSSRLNLKSKEKYYIPKYYSLAMLYNQFHAMYCYRNGLFSRSIEDFCTPEFFSTESPEERRIIIATIIVTAFHIIING